MENGQSGLFVVFLLLLLGAGIFWPRAGLAALARRQWVRRRRELFEDALKHILAWEGRGENATRESLAGALEISQRRTLGLITRMEAHGLVQTVTGGIRLTPVGERLALHVVRAHRLWERYLSDDAGVPISRLHQAAEKAEHHLSAEKLDALEAHLGHPRHDPHGDPIPAADGSFSPLDAVSLVEWPSHKTARIVHIEDEPDIIFQQILAADLRPGKAVRIIENDPQRLVVSDGEQEHRLARAVAANIQVVAPAPHSRRPEGSRRLSELTEGQAGEVVELDPDCRGFSRRRLLDLGLTPRARVSVELNNTFGDPRGYRVRGTMIALRRRQADQIWVRPMDGFAPAGQGAQSGLSRNATSSPHPGTPSEATDSWRGAPRP